MIHLKDMASNIVWSIAISTILRLDGAVAALLPHSSSDRNSFSEYHVDPTFNDLPITDHLQLPTKPFNLGISSYHPDHPSTEVSHETLIEEPHQEESKQVFHHQPSYAPPTPSYSLKPYSFDYGVHDQYSGTDFGHSETSDGEVVKGSYTVALPDGRIQKVTYTADKHNGYRATVTYEGEAKYPEYKPAPAPKPLSPKHEIVPKHHSNKSPDSLPRYYPTYDYNPVSNTILQPFLSLPKPGLYDLPHIR